MTPDILDTTVNLLARAASIYCPGCVDVLEEPGEHADALHADPTLTRLAWAVHPRFPVQKLYYLDRVHIGEVAVRNSARTVKLCGRGPEHAAICKHLVNES
jgi:hypothetical protein